MLLIGIVVCVVVCIVLGMRYSRTHIVTVRTDRIASSPIDISVCVEDSPLLKTCNTTQENECISYD